MAANPGLSATLTAPDGSQFFDTSPVQTAGPVTLDRGRDLHPGDHRRLYYSFATGSYNPLARPGSSVGVLPRRLQVTLSQPASSVVTVLYATQDNTSLAGTDYLR